MKKSNNVLPYLSYRGGSLLKIDPNGIMSAITKYGKIILPESMDHDLKVLKTVCQCERSSIDVIHQELEIRNFTVSVPGETIPALHVGRLRLKWNSYIRPCLEIELEDVDIVVEFTNLLLTRTNWNELSELGFPPMMYLSDHDTTTSSTSTSTSTSASALSMLRICSIDLTGVIKLRNLSRPLKEAITPDSTFQFSVLKELMDQIRTESNRAQTIRGQKGCTTDEVYDLITKFVNKRVRKLISSAVKDLAKSTIYPKQYESVTVQDTKKAFTNVMDSITSYADKVASVGEDYVQKKVKNQLQDWGLDSDKVGNVLKEVANTGYILSDKQEMKQEEKIKAQKEKIIEGLKVVSDDAIARFFDRLE